jgi:ERCC4-type nuclease
MFKIEYDDREREAVQYFDTLGGKRKVVCERRRLTTGDFAVWYGPELKIVVERKTWNDLAASVKDNRINEQMANMQRARVATGCAVVLIIEGRRQREHGHIESTSLETKLDHIMFRNEAHIIYTVDIAATVQRLFVLVDNLDIDFRAVAAAGAATDLLTATTEQTAEHAALAMFMSIPHVSVNTARVFMALGWSVLDLYNWTADILADIVYTSGAKMGAKRATQILNAMGTKRCWTDILSQTNGITKATAAIILTAHPDPMDWTAAALSTTQITKKMLGKKVSARAIAALNFRCALT